MKNKKLLLGILAILFVLISAQLATAQHFDLKKYQKFQSSMEYPAYKKNWMKNELKTAKENKKIKKERESESKKKSNFQAKLRRIEE